MARKTILEQKSREVEVLDKTTKELLTSMESNDRKRRRWGTVAFLVLFLVGITSIYYTIDLSRQNKEHIDCIVKLLVTPVKAAHKVIVDPNGKCNIEGLS